VMKIEKTIKCRILEPTDKKKSLLIKEYSNAQGYIRGETNDLYSATKQAMDRYVEKVQNEEYPLFLRNDTFRVEKAMDSEEGSICNEAMFCQRFINRIRKI